MFDSKRVINKVLSRECFVASKDLKVSNFYNPSNVDGFICSEHENAHTDKSVRITSDIYMLFNQQRLDKLSREALIQHFNDMQVNEPSLATLRSKMSDGQLITLVKSRFVQSNCELLSWSRYLNSLADSELQAYLAKTQSADDSQLSESVQPVEPAPASTE